MQAMIRGLNRGSIGIPQGQTRGGQADGSGARGWRMCAPRPLGRRHRHCRRQELRKWRKLAALHHPERIMRGWRLCVVCLTKSRARAAMHGQVSFLFKCGGVLSVRATQLCRTMRARRGELMTCGICLREVCAGFWPRVWSKSRHLQRFLFHGSAWLVEKAKKKEKQSRSLPGLLLPASHRR